MQSEVMKKIIDDPKMLKLLRENSYWYKSLNRNPNNYHEFIKDMKEKYKLKLSDKIANAMNGIDMVNNVLNVLKD